MTKKILLMGRASTGKSSIKKAIFEGANPNNLMIKPLEPTRGIDTTNYDWMDLNLSVFDSSGQEFNELFENDDFQKMAFENTSAVIYFFDYPLWMIKPEEIIEDIHRLYILLKNSYKQARLILILHKIDLINIKLRTRLSHIRNQILGLLNLPIDMTLYLTSIYPKMIFNSFNAFFEILSKLSEETFKIKKIMDKYLKFLSKSICFVTNLNNQIIAQTMTNDFNIKSVHPIHEFVANIDHSHEELEMVYDKIHLFGLGDNIYSLIITNLGSSNIKNLVCISELNGMNLIKDIIKNIKSEIVAIF